MAQLAASIVSHDEDFKRQVSRMLRAGGVPVGIVEGRADGAPDLYVVDIRNDAEGRPNFIEVNPVAGLRPDYSDMCFIATREGLNYRQLIGRIMESFLKRYPELKQRRAAA